MSGAVAFIRKLLGAGMPLEMALTAAEAFEHEVNAKLDLRKAKDRDRKRRSPRNSTESAESMESTDSADSTESTPPAPDKERSPRPPKEINPTPERCAAPNPDAQTREPDPVEDDWPEADGDGNRAIATWAARLSKLAGPGLADPQKTPSLLTSSVEIGRWRKAGCSWEGDVVPVIVARTLQPRPDPITAWSFFTQAILSQASRRQAALVIPLHPEGRSDVRKSPRPGSDRQAQFAERLSRIDAAMAAAVEQSTG